MEEADVCMRVFGISDVVGIWWVPRLKYKVLSGGVSCMKDCYKKERVLQIFLLNILIIEEFAEIHQRVGRFQDVQGTRAIRLRIFLSKNE
jgi:hypothetical protein